MELWTLGVASPRGSADYAARAEQAGWHGMLVVDSQNLSGDSYVALTMAAMNTTTLGLGVMLVANIPIMLVFGAQAMKEYHAYNRKLKAGDFHPHDAPSISDVMEGRDVE